MTEDLRLHWALHVLDEQAVACEAALAKHPEQRKLVDSKLAAAKSALAAIDKRLADSAARRRTLDGDIAAFDVQVKRFEKQLESVTDQKQFEAVNHEISAVRAKRDVLETEVLERLEAEEKDTAARPEKATALERAAADAQALNSKLDGEAAALKAELATLEAQRTATAAQLDPPSRSRYERLRTGRAGRAIAAVEQGACGACHSSLSPAGLQAARRREGLVTCDGCGRFMMLPPEGSGPA
ncbi:MAG: hypothetical protein K8R56_03310 [Candidatus Eisenbacteria bacterium]|nr:hypothetical protein [Candidatus Eisenbacteria bacterium]